MAGATPAQAARSPSDLGVPPRRASLTGQALQDPQTVWIWGSSLWPQTGGLQTLACLDGLTRLGACPASGHPSATTAPGSPGRYPMTPAAIHGSETVAGQRETGKTEEKEEAGGRARRLRRGAEGPERQAVGEPPPGQPWGGGAAPVRRTCLETSARHMGGPSPLAQENLPEDPVGPKAVSLRP